MKKLIIKDKKVRKSFEKIQKKRFILKCIYRNLNFSFLIRWNARVKLQNLTNRNLDIFTTNYCVYTINKKRFNKLTNLSRNIFIKFIRSGTIYGFMKSSW